MIDSEYFCHYVDDITTTVRNSPREVLKGWFGCVCVYLCVMGWGAGWEGNAKAFKS